MEGIAEMEGKEKMEKTDQMLDKTTLVFPTLTERQKWSRPRTICLFRFVLISDFFEAVALNLAYYSCFRETKDIRVWKGCRGPVTKEK